MWRQFEHSSQTHLARQVAKNVHPWVKFTVLRELGGAEETGDPERLLGAFQRLVVGREVGLREWQLQVARAVCQAGVLLTLETKRQRKTHILKWAEQVNRKAVEECDVIKWIKCGWVYKNVIGLYIIAQAYSCGLYINRDWWSYKSQNTDRRIKTLFKALRQTLSLLPW